MESKSGSDDRSILNNSLTRFPEILPVLPLRSSVLFPFISTPLQIVQERSLALIDDAVQGDRLVAVVAQRSADVEMAGPVDLHSVGTVARLAQVMRQPQGGVMVAVQGLERCQLEEYTSESPYLLARVRVSPDAGSGSVEVEALRRSVVDLFQRLVHTTGYLPDELATIVESAEDPRHVAYLIASSLRLSTSFQQEILETTSVAEKFRYLRSAILREMEIQEVGQQIESEVRQTLTRAQRDYYLREQLRAIQRELGEDQGPSRDVDEYRRRLSQVRLPTEAQQEAERELQRLTLTPPSSPEYGVIRTYLDWLVGLPWSVSSGASIDVHRARQVLDEDHYDIERVKDRILEYLAVRKLKEDRTGREPGEQVVEVGPKAEAMREPILCFVGPPGVGKTSLGQSIARAMGRSFVRVSLGGVRDEAEIRGHRRTYIAAMPGRIIQGIRRAGANDAVFMLDEVDKLTVSFQGDPASALLEVLDPAQNHTFTDHYLGVPFDLSRVLFIATANVLETMPAALLDRMEVIRLPGYTEEEKVHIAERYLVPKQRRGHGLTQDEVKIDSKALRRIVHDYTREAGVRNLEREIATVFRKAARQISEGAKGTVRLTADRLPDFLGPPRFFSEVAERTDRPGVVTGLAWTPSGGEIMFIEATMMPSRQNRLILTGQLGDVMKESAQAALSYLRSNAQRLGVDPTLFEDKDLHIHVPAGAVPKDGPSAGVAIATALASLITNRPVRPEVAMTGEVTLRGAVLPVGGIREKVLAAHRAGIRVVVLPRRNERDLEEVPKELRRELRFVLVDSADEVISEALAEPSRQAPPQPILVGRRLAAAAK